MRLLAVLLALAASSPALAQDAGATFKNAGAPPAAEGYGKTEGVIPGVLFGPKLTLLSLSPGVGLEVKLGSRLGFSFDYGFLPDVSVMGVKINYRDLSGAVRVYPFAGAFYLGASCGKRTFKAHGSSGADEARVTVDTTYLAPQLGWRWIWTNGFFLGTELGYQIVVDHKMSFWSTATADAGTIKDVNDAGDQIGKIGLPVASLFQVGYFF
jgi:hypothetical protein